MRFAGRNSKSRSLFQGIDTVRDNGEARTRSTVSSGNQTLFFSIKKRCTFYTEYIVTYSGFSIHDGTLLHSKSQYTTVKHSRKLFEHAYTSDLYGLGTLTPIEFFQQVLLWESSITHSNSWSQKASKHMSGQSIVGLSVRLYTTPAHRHIIHR
jgi:hypothetical protein